MKDVAGGAARTLPSTTTGLNTTPAFSPNGLTLAYSHGDEAGTDLMLVDVAGGAPRRITVGHGSDNTSPEFSPDGRRIAFTSGRAGHPEVYIMDLDGSNVGFLTPFNFEIRIIDRIRIGHPMRSTSRSSRRLAACSRSW